MRLSLRGLPGRIVLSVVLLVALLQAASFWLIAQANRDNALDHAREELGVGDVALMQALDDRRRDLRESARLLAADAGLRELAAGGDAAALAARLSARAALTPARIAQVVDAQGARAGVELPADGRIDGAGTPLRLASVPVLRAAQETGLAEAVVRERGRVFDVAIVPLPAATVTATAFLLLAAEYDQALATQIGEQTSLRPGFALAEGGELQPLAGTLAPPALAVLHALATPHSGRPESTVVAAGDGSDGVYRALAVAAAGDARVVALLQRPLKDVLPLFDRLHALLLVLAAGGVALALAAGAALARSVTRPLGALTDGAARMRDGDYREPIRAESDDQIGALAGSLDRMRLGLAEREQRIMQLAYEDVLTGLPNRARLIERLKVALRDAQRDGLRVAVMVLDLDRFKQVNDTLGHAAGDELLRRVGAALRGAVRPADTVARLGGDEFAVVLPGADTAAARTVARAIVAALKAPVEIEGQPVDVGGAIGIAVHPDHGSEVDTLLRCADIAMYAAKRNHAALAVYDPTHEVARREHLSLLGELRRAVADSELRAYYQPKLCLASGRPIGAEALVRWKHPQRGLLSPAHFIPYAEQTGFVRAITRWMLAVTLRQCGLWAAAGTPLTVAVNVSAADLMSSDLVKIVEDLLKAHAVPPRLVCLEITEGSFMQDPEYALRVLRELNALGLRLAIDDFGTGFSSLAYLKQLPVHELKIDQTFVRGMATSDKDASIVRSTIQLAHSLGLKVVAEGVEDKACVAQLQSMQCDLAQGYYLGRPMRRSQLEAWLQRRAEGGRDTGSPSATAIAGTIAAS